MQAITIVVFEQEKNDGPARAPWVRPGKAWALPDDANTEMALADSTTEN